MIFQQAGEVKSDSEALFDLKLISHARPAPLQLLSSLHVSRAQTGPTLILVNCLDLPTSLHHATAPSTPPVYEAYTRGKCSKQ